MRFLLGFCTVLIFQPQLFADEPGGGASQLKAPFTEEQFKTHVTYLSSDELEGREPGSEGSSKAAEYVTGQFQALGIRPLLQDGSWFQEFELNSRGGKVVAKNILAVFPGAGELKDQAVIVTAHPDHLGIDRSPEQRPDKIFNGADDNASGVAAMLLIAEALSKLEQDALPESYRTVIFASFDGEERGLAGSRYYVQHPVWSLEETAAVINFDSIGRLRMGKLYASDAATNPVLAKTAVDAAKSRGMTAETRFGGHGRSDHAVFIDREIPAMHFFTGANADYHQVTDEWERLNLEGGATIAWVGWQVLQAAISHPERLRYEKINPVFDIQFAINFVKMVGIVPMMNAQEGRYPQILYVLPGTAAEKYGLKSGDQIAGINGIRFQRVEDALTVFSQLTFAEGMRLAILRAGKEVDVHVPASFFEEMSGPKAKLLENGQYEVIFRYEAPQGVKQVYLAGEFNDWKPTALLMDGPGKKGTFTTRLELKAGVYEYKFVHEGTDWTADPRNLYRVGQHGNSVLWAGQQPK